MRTIENYRNFDIKKSRTGKIFAYSDSDLSEYEEVKFTRSFETVSEDKDAIDGYWRSK
ncbi:hypothetical protein [Lactococcus lactis]|uniref:hypothetical protein n=1 Tax=Lactococcus lactis TaxID=1358 RepID=UPI0018AB0068|nr:hypothetical protein [Lactococcus lactis]